MEKGTVPIVFGIIFEKLSLPILKHLLFSLASSGKAPVLLETFVDRDRFSGTSYRAANWLAVGRTQGRGKNDRDHQSVVSVKEVFLYPLKKAFREILNEDAHR